MPDSELAGTVVHADGSYVLLAMGIDIVRGRISAKVIRRGTVRYEVA